MRLPLPRARLRLSAVSVAAALLAVLVAACGGGAGGSGVPWLAPSANSTPQEAYEEIIPAFRKTAAGDGVEFRQSYGSSGDQARAVEAGLDADVVALSLAPDVDKLVEAKKVAADWSKDKYDGFVTNSVV